MKTKTFILLGLLICNLLPAQNVKLDIKPHFLGVRELITPFDGRIGRNRGYEPEECRHTDTCPDRAQDHRKHDYRPSN